MQQILSELTNGTIEVIKDNEDGTLTTIQRPPTALQLRTKRLIEQILHERDGAIRAYQALEKQIAELFAINELLKQQVKVNDNVSNVSETVTETNNQINSGSDSERKDESAGSAPIEG